MINRTGIPFSYNLMAKPVGSNCNLKCDYCYYKDKSQVQHGTSSLMTERVLEQYVKQYIQSQTGSTVVFSWQGGEPLLAGLDFYKKALKLQDIYKGEKRIENSLQTNASLITGEWGRFFRNNNFLVGVSVDGPREIHDFHRNDHIDSGSWERTMKGLSIIRDLGVPFNTLTTVNSHTVRYPKEIYQFLKGLGSNYQQYSPVVERYSQKGRNQENQLASPDCMEVLDLAPWALTPEGYGQFLISIYDEWIRKDVGDIFIQQFEASLASWLGEDPGICLFQSTCGKALMIEKSGDVYACDHFGFPSFKRGNIAEIDLIVMVSSEKQLGFGLNKFTSLPGSCRACEFLFACYGECPRNRFLVSDDGESGLNYLCKAYKQYFRHVSPSMNYMAEQIRLGKSPVTVKDSLDKL